MGEIYDEFERDLKRWRERYRDRPELERERLLLLALEREQLVTVAYPTELMKERIEEQDLPADLKEVFAHSLAWAWKDEELHAIYTRGLLIRLGKPSLKIRAVMQQLAGMIGGWSSSVEQHVPWSRAPLSRAIAKLAALGWLAGKVTRASVSAVEQTGGRRRHGSLKKISRLRLPGLTGSIVRDRATTSTAHAGSVNSRCMERTI